MTVEAEKAGDEAAGKYIGTTRAMRRSLSIFCGSSGDIRIGTMCLTGRAHRRSRSIRKLEVILLEHEHVTLFIDVREQETVTGIDSGALEYLARGLLGAFSSLLPPMGHTLVAVFRNLIMRLTPIPFHRVHSNLLSRSGK